MNFQKISNLFFFLFIFLLPWQTIYFFREPFFSGEKWHYGVIGIYFSEIFLVVWIFLETILQRKNLKKIFQDNRKFFWLSCFFFFSFFLSVFQAKDKWISLYFSFLFFLGISLFWLLKNSKLEIKKIILIFIFSAFIQSFLGLYQFIFQTSFSNKYLGLEKHEIWQGGTAVIENESGRWLRAYGGFSHPNIFGGYLFLAFSLSFGGYLFLAKSQKEKLFYFFSFNLFFLALLSSFSRSAFLAFVFFIFFLSSFIFFRQKKFLKNLFLTFIFFLSLFFIFFLSYSNLFLTRTKIESRLEKKSVSERISQIHQSVLVIKNNVFLGVGLGNYTLIQWQNDIKKPIWWFQPVHNIYLLLFSESGLFSFLLFLSMIFYQFLLIFKNKSLIENFDIVFKGSFLGLLIIGFFDHWIFSFYFGIVIFWFYFSLFSFFNFVFSAKN